MPAPDTRPDTAPDPEILAELAASAPRRLFALGVLAVLGALLWYLALASDTIPLGARAFLLALGLGVLVLAVQLRHATALTLRLTPDALCDSSGRVLARVDGMASVSRGTFAMKPTHGFSVRLKSRHGRVWAPGMWWRFGTRLGIGGVTAGGQAKFMSEILATLLARREGDENET